MSEPDLKKIIENDPMVKKFVKFTVNFFLILTVVGLITTVGLLGLGICKLIELLS